MQPSRGLSLYMSVLSIVAIEVFTYLEFAASTLFFFVWTVVFLVLAAIELSQEISRTRASKARADQELQEQQVPKEEIQVIELDVRNLETISEGGPSVGTSLGEKHKHWIQKLKSLDDSLLVVAFSLFSVLNLAVALAFLIFDFSI